MGTGSWIVYMLLGLAGLVVVLGLLYVLWPVARERMQQLGHASWPVVRQILGWLFIVLGFIGLVLPLLQGWLFLAIGVLLLGRNNPVVRRVRVIVERRLNLWARKPGMRGWIGEQGLTALDTMRVQIRRMRVKLRSRFGKKGQRQPEKGG